MQIKLCQTQCLTKRFRERRTTSLQSTGYLRSHIRVSEQHADFETNNFLKARCKEQKILEVEHTIGICQETICPGST